MKSTISAVLAPLLVASLLLFLACNGEGEDAPELEMPDTTMVDDFDALATGEADTIHVALTGDGIDLPASVQAGSRVLHVMNEDTEQHSLEISGMNMQQSLTSPVAAGEEATLEVDLQPGSYDAFCPVDNHADQGERATLEVTEEHMDATSSPQRPGSDQNTGAGGTQQPEGMQPQGGARAN